MVDGQRIMIWLNYRRGPSISVPAPFDDGTPDTPWWYDVIASKAQSLAGWGFTDALFPQPCKTQSGAYRTGDGYGVYDQYDIGSKNQCGGIPTRFGSAEQLRRAIAVCRANGINVLIDHVMHQLSGGKGDVYNYLGADGKTLNGRFPKFKSCFRGSPSKGYVPEDAAIPDIPNDFSFGSEFEYDNGIPKNYNRDGMMAATEWLFATLGVQGARIDDTKGMSLNFQKYFFNHDSLNGKFFFGEYASGNRNDTEWWVNQVDRIPSAADFDIHYNVIQPICNNATHYNMHGMKGRGMNAIDPMKSVTFVESMDSDTNGFATVIFDKILGYAILLTQEGLPQVYIRDYLKEVDCYGLQEEINKLCWVHAVLAHGSTEYRYGDNSMVVYERVGYPNLLVGLNNDVWNPQWKPVTVQTGFGAHVEIKDYTGKNPTHYWTDAHGKVTIWLPPGANGQGYSCYSRVGMDQKIKPKSFSTTQTFFGAADLDTMPATNSKLIVGRIWCAEGSPITSSLVADTTGWTETSSIEWALFDNNDRPAGGGTLPSDGSTPSSHSTAGIEGWHTLIVTGNDLPAGGSNFELTVTYTAPKTFRLPGRKDADAKA
jgi:alpha-amylase